MTVTLEIHRAAPADLQRVAGMADEVGSPTTQWSIFSPRAFSQSSILTVPLIGGAFLVAGDEQADRAFRLCPQIARRRRDKGGDGRFHVGGAAAIQHAVRDLGGEGIVRHSLRPAAPHRCGRQSRNAAPRSQPGIEIVDHRRSGRRWQ